MTLACVPCLRQGDCGPAAALTADHRRELYHPTQPRRKAGHVLQQLKGRVQHPQANILRERLKGVLEVAIVGIVVGERGGEWLFFLHHFLAHPSSSASPLPHQTHD